MMMFGWGCAGATLRKAFGFTDLRREMEQAQGEKFDLKTFHNWLLSFGSPPVQFVRALMLDREIPR